MDQFDSDKDLNTLDEMFLESIKNKNNANLNNEIKIDIESERKVDNLDSIFIKEYSDITTKKIQANSIATSTKKKRGRPKGSIKKQNRRQVANEKLTISLSKEEKEMLEKEAARDHRSVSSFIKLKLIQAGVFIKK